MTESTSPAVLAPLVLHLLYRFDTGGLENGVVNLINHMPLGAYRHAVVALTDVSSHFARRLHRPDVDCYALQKPPGHGLRIYPDLWRLLRRLRPAVVHSRNLAALECQPVAAAAGVPLRIHSEHGRDLGDLRSANRRYRWMRQAYDPFVHHYVALSADLERFLVDEVGVRKSRVSRICNGVDTSRFSRQSVAPSTVSPAPFADAGLFVFGTVGRMQTIKNQVALAKAFAEMLALHPDWRRRVRLVMVGDGPQRVQSRAILQAAGVEDLAWLPGERADVPDIMSGLDCFVLPSLSEGISNTILEAMACGLPVVATDVGGNAELVENGQTGLLVSVADPSALTRALMSMVEQPDQALAMGRTGRERVVREFSLHGMVTAYQALYDQALSSRLASAN
jgi:sugar transferase (PEP-CTERM/EpsH1 system associated)